MATNLCKPKKPLHRTKMKQCHQQIGKSYHFIFPLNPRPTEKLLVFIQ